MNHNKLLRCFIRNKYSKVLTNHFEKPLNVGSFDNKQLNIGTGLVGAPACGDVMKLQIEISNGKVIDTKFKTFGCGSAIASSSYVSELIKGKTIDECLKIKNKEIASYLKLPPVKLHCSMLAEDAIISAINDYNNKNNLNKNI